MEAISEHKYLRISQKKIKSLSRLMVGLLTDVAVNKLEFISGKAPKFLSAAIKSAKANAVNNLKLNPANLIIKEVITQKGPFFKRWQPVSRGNAHSIKKRTTHITVKVAERVVPKKTLPAVNKTNIKENK